MIRQPRAAGLRDGSDPVPGVALRSRCTVRAVRHRVIVMAPVIEGDAVRIREPRASGLRDGSDPVPRGTLRPLRSRVALRPCRARCAVRPVRERVIEMAPIRERDPVLIRQAGASRLCDGSDAVPGLALRAVCAVRHRVIEIMPVRERDPVLIRQAGASRLSDPGDPVPGFPLRTRLTLRPLRSRFPLRTRRARRSPLPADDLQYHRLLHRRHHDRLRLRRNYYHILYYLDHLSSVRSS